MDIQKIYPNQESGITYNRTLTNHLAAIYKIYSRDYHAYNNFLSILYFQVWEIENLLEFVHPVEQMEMKIDKLVLCEPANTVVSLTRGGLGFWSMETGALDCRIADTTGGK